MTTTHDQHQAQLAGAAWAFDPDQVQAEVDTSPSPSSTAAQLVNRAEAGRKAAADDQDQVIDQLQARRQRRLKARRRTRGLSTAEILAVRRLGTG